MDDPFDGSTIGEVLLEPTRIYVKDMAKVSKQVDCIAINNTGYGLKNLNRLKGSHEFHITDPLKPQPIFDLIMQEGKFSLQEM